MRQGPRALRSAWAAAARSSLYHAWRRMGRAGVAGVAEVGVKMEALVGCERCSLDLVWVAQGVDWVGAGRGKGGVGEAAGVEEAADGGGDGEPGLCCAVLVL